MITVPRTFSRTLLWMQSGNLADQASEILPVAVARFSLLGQSIELAIQDRTLKFAESIVARNDVVLVPNAARNAPAVLNRTARLGQRVVVRRNDAAFARRQVLARLKRERAEMPNRTGRPIPITCPVRVGCVLDNDQLVLPGDS